MPALLAKLLGGLGGIQTYLIVGALVAAAAFGAGWTVNGWRHSATELGRLSAALEDAHAKVIALGDVARASAQTQAGIIDDALRNSQRIAAYVETTNACRISADDVRVWNGTPAASND